MSRTFVPSVIAASAAGFVVAAVATARTRPALLRVPARGVLAAPSPVARLGASRLGKWVRPRARDTQEEAASGWTPDEIAGARLLGLAAIAALSLLAPATLVLAAPAGLALVRLPELTARRSGRRRARAACGELPLFLDLLAVATSAGLSPLLAVRAAAAPLRGPLASELGEVIGSAALGRRWQVELEAAASRLGLPDLRRAVTLLRRTQAHGSSLADEMQRLAADVRDERRARAVERARLAPVKMLFPLVFLILPAFLLLTVAPVLLSTVRSIG